MSRFPARLSSHTQKKVPAGLESMEGNPWGAPGGSSLRRRFTVEPTACGFRIVTR